MPKVPSFLKFRTSYGSNTYYKTLTGSAPLRGGEVAADALAQDLETIWQRVSKLLNGGISFGNGTQSDNVDGVWANIVTPGVADTDFTLTHNLGRVPVGYIVKSKSAACDVYDGSVVASKTQLTLRATAANISIR